MGKIKEALKKAGNAFIDAMTLEDEQKKTGAQLLEESRKAPKYEKVAIYEKGDIITTSAVGEVFLDCTETFAFIKSINGEPLGEMMMGLTVYSPAVVEHDLGRITELSTWLALVGNKFTDGIKDNEDNALRFALMSSYAIPDTVFDLLYAAYPETELVDILYDCKRLDAVKWAVAHGADRFYDGFRDPMQKILSWTKRGPEAEAIYRYLYEEDPNDYGKEKTA